MENFVWLKRAFATPSWIRFHNGLSDTTFPLSYLYLFRYRIYKPPTSLDSGAIALFFSFSRQTMGWIFCKMAKIALCLVFPYLVKLFLDGSSLFVWNLHRAELKSKLTQWPHDHLGLRSLFVYSIFILNFKDSITWVCIFLMSEIFFKAVLLFCGSVG